MADVSQTHAQQQLIAGADVRQTYEQQELDEDIS